MKKHTLTLVLGGAASGKSEFAESLAGRAGRRILYLATELPGRGTRSPEWRNKIAAHRSRRPDAWRTEVLNGRSPDLVLSGPRPDGILLDSLSLWISARYQKEAAGHLQKSLRTLLQVIRTRAPLIVVSDEAGLGLVPPNLAGRKFLEILGRCNALLAGEADRVYFVVSGQPLKIK